MARKLQVSQASQSSDMDTDACRRKRAAAVVVISCCSELLGTEQPKEKKKSIWVKEWLKKKDRSVYNMLLSELLVQDQEDFRKYLRMNTETFQVELF